MKTIYRILLSASTLLSLPAFAAVPHTFTAGTPARAEEVNANFSDLDTRLRAVENQVAEIGAVSVASYGFTNHTGDSSGCVMRGTQNYRFFAAGNNCRATASVTIPHDATVTSAHCRVHDEEVTPTISVMLARMNLFNDGADVIYDGASSGSSGSQFLNLADASVAAAKLVDNTTYAYYFNINFETTSIVTTTSLRIYSCKAHYTLPSS